MGGQGWVAHDMAWHRDVFLRVGQGAKGLRLPMCGRQLTC
jgi:hypothetical protein